MLTVEKGRSKKSSSLPVTDKQQRERERDRDRERDREREREREDKEGGLARYTVLYSQT